MNRSSKLIGADIFGLIVTCSVLFLLGHVVTAELTLRVSSLSVALLFLLGFYRRGLRAIDNRWTGVLLAIFSLSSLVVVLATQTLDAYWRVSCISSISFLALRAAGTAAVDLYYRYVSKLRKVYVFGVNGHSLIHYDLLQRSGRYWPLGFISDSDLSGKAAVNAKSKRWFLKAVSNRSVDWEVHVAPGYYGELEDLQIPTGLHIHQIPEVVDYLDHRVSQRPIEIHEIDIDTLLHRGVVNEYPDLNPFFVNKTVLVTGGAGSIGSELVAQLLNLEVCTVIALDSSELSLYQLTERFSGEYRLVTRLLSVTDFNGLSALFGEYDIDVVFHAAAYKHVPLVEASSIVGLQNNVYGTVNVADLAIQHNVQNFCLISTDKAVRPTNVMGASKRICEKVISERALQSATVFSSVRFGNVLGSSGSVIPKFLKQINSGGPITITDMEITRYFMSISEAANLVMTSTAMSRSGALFLLDMGQPVKILDLAKSLLMACGRSFVIGEDAGSDPNAINIIETGLRPGEKLFEELLIEGEPISTEHPKIFRAVEDEIDSCEIEMLLTDLSLLTGRSSPEVVRQFLNKHVDGYKNVK